MFHQWWCRGFWIQGDQQKDCRYSQIIRSVQENLKWNCVSTWNVQGRTDSQQPREEGIQDLDRRNILNASIFPIYLSSCVLGKCCWCIELWSCKYFLEVWIEHWNTLYLARIRRISKHWRKRILDRIIGFEVCLRVQNENPWWLLLQNYMHRIKY